MAFFLNLLIPGTGLILRRREWLGLSIALLFSICGNAAIAGFVIAPAAIPSWFTQLATGLAILVWFAAQILSRRQGRYLQDSAVHFRTLMSEAMNAADRNDIESARLALEGACAIDPENSELGAMRNRLHLSECTPESPAD